MPLETIKTEPVTTPTPTSDAQAIIDAVTELAEPTVLCEIANDDVLVVHSDQRVISLKPYKDALRERPERKTGEATLDTLESFIAHANRFKSDCSAVFVNEERLLAVYDYHHSMPAFLEHRALYEFPLSPEWRAWTRVSEQTLPQQVFAEFLETRIMDVAAPKDGDSEKYFAELGFTLASPSALLALSRGLRVRVEQEAVSKPNLSSGEIEVAFKEQHSDAAGAPLKVPGGFVLHIAPYVQGTRYAVPVRLRYRVAGGKVQWTMILHRTDLVLCDALKDAAACVAEQTGLPVFYGAPEPPWKPST
jgi:uncharacterized protein YfdQ (DUF2303 family)